MGFEPILAFTGYTIQRGRLANQELQFINQPLRDNKEGKEHVFAYLLDQKFKLSYWTWHCGHSFIKWLIIKKSTIRIVWKYLPALVQ